MTSPRPAPASYKLPLHIRNVSCDQWIRLSIDSSCSVATLKSKVIDCMGIGDEEPDLYFDISRLHSDNEQRGTASLQKQSRPGLSPTTATGAHDRSFLARAPKAVLATQPRLGPQLADTIAARRQAELILGGHPGKGGPGSMPRAQISPCTPPALCSTKQLRRSHSLGISHTQESPRRDLGSSQHTTAESPLRRRLPRTATSDESIASVLALAQASDVALTSTPSSRVVTTPSSSRDDPFQHTSYLKTQASISSLSGAGDDEFSPSPQSVSLDLARTSTESNGPNHTESAKADVVPTSSPPPLLERQGPAPVLRGNVVAKQREEEALRRLNESLEKSGLALSKRSTASSGEPRQPALSTSTTGNSAGPSQPHRPTLMTANARRAQRQKRRALEFLEAEDLVPEHTDDQDQGTEPDDCIAASSSHLRASFWIPAGEVASPDDGARKELSPDTTSAGPGLEAVPVGVDVVWSRHEASGAISPQSPASSSGTSYHLNISNAPSTSSSRDRHLTLETTNEQRL